MDESCIIIETVRINFFEFSRPNVFNFKIYVLSARKNAKKKSDEERYNEAQLVVVGEVEKMNIIQRCHAEFGGAHFGKNKTQE